MDLTERAREWLVDRQVGLIDDEELVARADAALGESEDAPAFLIALSSGEPIDEVSRLDLQRDRMAASDLEGLAGKAREGLRGRVLAVLREAAGA